MLVIKNHFFLIQGGRNKRNIFHAGQIKKLRLSGLFFYCKSPSPVENRLTTKGEFWFDSKLG